MKKLADIFQPLYVVKAWHWQDFLFPLPLAAFMLCSGFCATTSLIDSAEARLAAWIILLVTGLAWTYVPYGWLERSHHFLFRIGIYWGGNWMNHFVDLLLLFTLALFSWFTGFALGHPALHGAAYHATYSVLLACTLTAYAAILAWSYYLHREQLFQVDHHYLPTNWHRKRAEELPPVFQEQLIARGLWTRPEQRLNPAKPTWVMTESGVDLVWQ